MESVRNAVPRALQLTAAVSRKKRHGGAGDFDINLPLAVDLGSNAVTVAAINTLVFTTSNDLVSGNAQRDHRDRQRLRQSHLLWQHHDSEPDRCHRRAENNSHFGRRNRQLGSSAPGHGSERTRLIGDTNGDRFVNAGDTLQTRNPSRSGDRHDELPLRRYQHGLVNVGDTTVVRAGSGAFLPVSCASGK